jgi:site-specific recombinase XerD
VGGADARPRRLTAHLPVLVADLMGHAGLDTLRVYTHPADEDRERTLAVLTTDH